MNKLTSGLSKIILMLTLRAKFYKVPINLPKLACREELSVGYSLDLGSGPSPRNPFGARIVFGLDVRSYDLNYLVGKCILGVDSIPFEDNFFDTITAVDVLEHISRVAINSGALSFPFIELMNEVWRVLKVGGLFYSETPCFPMKEAFQDPTHVNIMTEDTIPLYFGDRRWANIYGFVGSFSVIEEGWLGNKYICILKKTTAESLFNVNDPQTNA
jgi:SAM-dependent methyltransferase